jgi:translation elongation factor EF-Tu-like GTPase
MGSSQQFRMKIENVFEIRGRGAVVTGCVEEGPIAVGDEVQAFGWPAERRSTVAGIETYRTLHPEARPGDQVGLLLAGVSSFDIAPGEEIRRT